MAGTAAHACQQQQQDGRLFALACKVPITLLGTASISRACDQHTNWLPALLPLSRQDEDFNPSSSSDEEEGEGEGQQQRSGGSGGAKRKRAGKGDSEHSAPVGGSHRLLVCVPRPAGYVRTALRLTPRGTHNPPPAAPSSLACAEGGEAGEAGGAEAEAEDDSEEEEEGSSDEESSDEDDGSVELVSEDEFSTGQLRSVIASESSGGRRAKRQRGEAGGSGS